MHVILYKRHKKDCPHKSERHYKRCDCPVWFETNINGVQKRQTSGMSSWESAQKKARMIEQQHEDAELGRSAKPGATKTVNEAVALYIDSKRGEDLAENALYKHKLTLSRLQEFCDREGLLFVKDITLSHLTTWRARWPFESPLAKRNNQERVKGFFKFAYEAGMVPVNPAAQLSAIQVKADEANSVCPFEPKEYEQILAAVKKTKMTPRNAVRVKALMQLQRWSGLSLVDAVCLSKDELVQDGNTFRVRTQRRKTGVHINNVIPGWLGKELLAVKNSHPKYFFISGEATPKGAVSTFDKLYRRVFNAAGVDGSSHEFRHTFSVELLKAGVDIRKVSKALGHSSVVITERYYARWNKAQQDILDGDLAGAWGKAPKPSKPRTGKSTATVPDLAKMSTVALTQ
jgi:integrase/recombinase XerD